MCHDIKQLRLRLYTIHLTPENGDFFAIYLHKCKKIRTFAG